jgi:hypothetical protein
MNHCHLSLDNEIDALSLIFFHEQEVIADKGDLSEASGQLRHEVNAKVLDKVYFLKNLSLQVHL